MLNRISHVRLFCNPMDCSSPGSSVQGFSRQESWSGLPCPFARDLPDTGISPHLLRLLYWQAGSLPLAPPGKRSIFSVCFFLQCNLDNKNSHLLVFILCQGFWLVLKKPCFISSSQQTREKGPVGGSFGSGVSHWPGASRLVGGGIAVMGCGFVWLFSCCVNNP